MEKFNTLDSATVIPPNCNHVISSDVLRIACPADTGNQSTQCTFNYCSDEDEFWFTVVRGGGRCLYYPWIPESMAKPRSGNVKSSKDSRIEFARWVGNPKNWILQIIKVSCALEDVKLSWISLTRILESMKWICSCLNGKVQSSWIFRNEDISTIKLSDDCVTVYIIASTHSKCLEKCTAASGRFAGSLPHGGLKRRLVKQKERMYMDCLMDRDAITVNWVVKIDSNSEGIGKKQETKKWNCR